MPFSQLPNVSFKNERKFSQIRNDQQTSSLQYPLPIKLIFKLHGKIDLVLVFR